MVESSAEGMVISITGRVAGMPMDACASPSSHSVAPSEGWQIRVGQFQRALDSSSPRAPYLTERRIQLVHVALEVHGPAVLRARCAVRGRRHAREVGQAVHRQVDFEGAARVVGVPQVPHEVSRQRAAPLRVRLCRDRVLTPKQLVRE